MRFLLTVIVVFGWTINYAQSNIRYYTESSRPKDKVQQEFPFDIDLKKADGTVINSSKLLKANGKPTILMFWLTTCGPCRMELAAISGKFEQWQKEQKFNFYAISTDWQENSGQFVKKVQESKWPFEAFHDFNREFRLVIPGELNGLPQVFLFDKNGKIVYQKRKYIPGDEDLLIAEVKKLL